MHPRHHVGQSPSSGGVSDFLGSIPGPYQAGQQLGQAAQDAVSSLSGSVSSTISGVSGASDAAQQAYQDQAQRAADLLKQQQLQASGSAQGAASNLGAIVLIAAAGIILALVLTRK
jgi:hypothetical protein